MKNLLKYLELCPKISALSVVYYVKRFELYLDVLLLLYICKLERGESNGSVRTQFLII